MKRLTLIFSLSAFIAVVFLFAPSAPAQNRLGGGFGLVQSDYENYAQLFRSGMEPSLSPVGSERWRTLYRNHSWADYAAGGEFREPMLAAQTLVGIYLVEHVDHQLTYRIETIVFDRAHMSAALAERITLDRISSYWERATSGFDESLHDPVLQDRMSASSSGDDFYSEDEIYRMQIRRLNIDVIARGKMINGRSLSNRLRADVRSVQNLFDHGENHRNWWATYYHMREKFDILDSLADSFTFNWDDERREEELTAMAENMSPVLRRRIEREVRDEFLPLRRAAAGMPATTGMGGFDQFGGGDDGSFGFDDDGGMGMAMAPFMMTSAPTGMTEQMIEEEEQRELQRRLHDAVEDGLARRELREKAYQYVVGVYESSDFHLGTLRRIHRYFDEAAKAGDPIAQYHLALFLMHLGDFVRPSLEDAQTRRSEYETWLDNARKSDPAMGRRVAELEAMRAGEERETRVNDREEEKVRKLRALVKVENDKLDMYDDVLIRVRDRISSGTGTGSSSRGGMSGSGGMMGGGGGMMGGGSGGMMGAGGGGRMGGGGRSSGGY